jgi:hypothetical protein
MTTFDALSLLGQGLKCLMDSDRPCRDNLCDLKYTLDGTGDDCEMIVNFVKETEDEETGGGERKRYSFLVKAEEICAEEEID